MLDPHLLRTRIQEVAHRLQTRGCHLDVERYTALETQRKSIQVETQQLQNIRNQNSKAIGIAKSKGEPVDQLLEDMAQCNARLDTLKIDLQEVLDNIDAIVHRLPNLPDHTVPFGSDESDNLEIRRQGDIPVYDFEPQSHDLLGETLGFLDFQMAAKITGSRFVVMYDKLAKLHRALVQFMLDVHTQEHAYREIYVPYIVNQASLFGTGQLPNLEEDLFRLATEQAYYLTPTAEIPVTNTVRDQILDLAQLPIRYVCHSPCFRSEAGSYGKDTKGMIRQHQFEKVELVWITTPERSVDDLELLTAHAEAILKKLQLPYRVVSLCTGDLGQCAAKTYDLEVWLPSQKMYREISSCSNDTDYQARRMQARYRKSDGALDYVHTLNGSALAIGRTMVAILENYQTQTGAIRVPDILIPYMGGMELIA